MGGIRDCERVQIGRRYQQVFHSVMMGTGFNNDINYKFIHNNPEILTSLYSQMGHLTLYVEKSGVRGKLKRVMGRGQSFR